jgi:hypothetical protein
MTSDLVPFAVRTSDHSSDFECYGPEVNLFPSVTSEFSFKLRFRSIWIPAKTTIYCDLIFRIGNLDFVHEVRTNLEQLNALRTELDGSGEGKPIAIGGYLGSHDYAVCVFYRDEGHQFVFESLSESLEEGWSIPRSCLNHKTSGERTGLISLPHGTRRRSIATSTIVDVSVCPVSLGVLGRWIRVIEEIDKKASLTLYE